MNKKRVLIILLLLILVIISIPLIHTLRNFIIINGLQKNLQKYSSSDNYSVVSADTENGIETTRISFYKKGNKTVTIQEQKMNGESMKTSTYNNGERIDTFFDTPTSKSARLDSKSNFFSDNTIYNYLETNSFWEKIKLSFHSKIKSEEYNGKSCYVIEIPTLNERADKDEKNEYFIEKDTGLCLKIVSNNLIQEKTFEFNKVKDDVFVEPDISQYTLQENIIK